MIFNEEEIRKYGREKRVLFPVKKLPEKKEEKLDTSPLLMAAIKSVFDLVTNSAKNIQQGFNAIDEKLDSFIKFQPSEQKQPETDKWDFHIKRDISDRIIKIEARRK